MLVGAELARCPVVRVPCCQHPACKPQSPLLAFCGWSLRPGACWACSSQSVVCSVKRLSDLPGGGGKGRGRPGIFLGEAGRLNPPLTSSSIKRGNPVQFCASVSPLRTESRAAAEHVPCITSTSAPSSWVLKAAKHTHGHPWGLSAPAGLPGGEPPATTVPSLGLTAARFSHLELSPQRKTHIFC